MSVAARGSILPGSTLHGRAALRRCAVTRAPLAAWLAALGLACAGAPPAAQSPPAQSPPAPAPPTSVSPPATPGPPERRADLASEAPPEGPLGPHWRERHDALLRASGRSSAQLVLLGGSLADGWHGSRAFQKQWRERKPLNLALPGDQTQQLLWRVEHGALDGLSPRLVVLAAGTENLAQGFTPAQTARGVDALLEQLGERLPGSAVLLLGLLPAGQSPADPLRAASDATNRELGALASAARVTFADVGGVFLEPDGSLTPGMLNDDGEPTPLGYEALTISVSLLAQRLLEQPAR